MQRAPRHEKCVLLLQVIPLYCFDPRQFCATPWENAKTGAVRAQFLLQSVLDLKQSLRRIGSDLVIHLGMPEDAVEGGFHPLSLQAGMLAVSLECTSVRARVRARTEFWDLHAGLLPEGGGNALVLTQSEVTSEEAEADAGIRAKLGQRGRLQLLWGNTLFHIDDLPFAPDMADLPDVFTPFRNKARMRAFRRPVLCMHALLLRGAASALIEF
jgi:deoxyribodipyrimidine photo-lyase